MAAEENLVFQFTPLTGETRLALRMFDILASAYAHFDADIKNLQNGSAVTNAYGSFSYSAHLDIDA